MPCAVEEGRAVLSGPAFWERALCADARGAFFVYNKMKKYVTKVHKEELIDRNMKGGRT